MVALGLLAADAFLALVGEPTTLNALLALIVAPGLALQPLLPHELGTVGRWAAVPIVGCAASSLAIISASTLGISLTGLGLRLVLLALVLAGLAASRRWRFRGTPPRADRSVLTVALGLAAILCAAVALQAPVLGGSPVPGTDWGHYLLYPDQIAAQHSLRIDNPFWMGGGEPFRDDPGVAGLYGGFLILSHAGTSVLEHGIWVFALLAIVSVFLLAGSLWGSWAGLGAAAIYAAIPMNNTMLGWHGLANLYALCLLPLVLLAAGWALRGRAGPSWSFLLALSLVALASAHRLTLLVGGLALGATWLLGLLSRENRGRLVGFALRTAAFAVPLGLLVFIDLSRRGSGSGGVQSYKVYLVTKVDWSLAVRDLTWPVTIAGLLALAALLTRVRRDPALLAVYGAALGVLLLSYGWIFHLPTVYYRSVYYVPLVLAVAIGVGVAELPRRWAGRLPARGRLVPAFGVALAVIALVAGLTTRDRSPGVRSFYAWASDASLRGLAQVTSRTGPRDLVVADRCWSFLAEWLLDRPILAGIDPADILPKWEAAPAAAGRRILYGSSAQARRLATARRVRYALVNPGCKSDETGALRLPSIGRPIYESTRLVVVDLAAADANVPPPRGTGAAPLTRAPATPKRQN